MLYIPTLLGSTRRGRQSPRVATFVTAALARTGRVETRVLDLADYDLPMMEERLRMRDDPPPRLVEFAAEIARADGLCVVSPEYNAGYPGVLKNALDYLLPELKRKPVGIVTVSAGPNGGVSCLAQLRTVLLVMGALPVPASLGVARVGEALDDAGQPLDASLEKRAASFLDELLFWTQAAASQRRAPAT